jgi:hypothetical protein
MNALAFTPHQVSLTRGQKCKITWMEGSNDRWLTICHEDEKGQKDLAKTINLSIVEVQAFQQVIESVWEIVSKEEDDDKYEFKKFAKATHEISWDTDKKLLCYVLQSDRSEEMLNDKVYRTDDDATLALNEYDNGEDPTRFKVKQITMNQPSRQAVVEFVVREELQKIQGPDKDIKGTDRGFIGAVLARTLKGLEFDSPINALDLLDMFLYFGGLEKVMIPAEISDDVHDRQQRNLIHTVYNSACTYVKAV